MRVKVFYCAILALVFYIVPFAEGNDSHNTGHPDKIKFILYTSKSHGIAILGNKSTRVNTGPWKGHFNPHNETKILTHGWRGNLRSPEIQLLKEKYFHHQHCNVIAIDWSSFSNLGYAEAVEKVKVAGQITAKMFQSLITANGANTKKFHLIGFSMGAHLMGSAGGFSSPRVGRITGLDPAGPLIEFSSEHLNKGDADFVDVIHTCSSVLGIAEPIGHADFYPNKGFAPQPGCGMWFPILCSHARAYKYFAESISNPTAFHACPSPSWGKYKTGECNSDVVIMGDAAPTTAKGKYYLRTNRKLPFGDKLTKKNPNRNSPFGDKLNKKNPNRKSPGDKLTKKNPNRKSPGDKLNKKNPNRKSPFGDKLNKKNPNRNSPFGDKLNKKNPNRNSPFGDKLNKKNPNRNSPLGDKLNKKNPNRNSPFGDKLNKEYP